MGTTGAVPLPQSTLINSALPAVHYADAYRISLPPSLAVDMDTLAETIFDPPRWVAWLLALRDLLVRPLGLKAGAAPRGAGAVSQGRAMFETFARAADELVMGLDDRHLNFRVSILRQATTDETTVTLSTIVQFNSWLGRLYFVPVRMVHRLLVPLVMRRARQRLRAGCPARKRES